MTITTLAILTEARKAVATPDATAVDPTVIAVVAPYGAAGPKIYGTSNSTVIIGNTGTKTFLINEDGRAFTPGTRVRAAATGSVSGSIPTYSYSNWIEGVVTAWDPNTKIMQVTADLSGGSGTASAWNINVAGERGQQGIQGPIGPQGTPGGPPGPAGATGASAGSRYMFNTAVSGDPGTGRFRFNNATPANATVLSISEVDANSMAVNNMLAAMDDGTSATKSIVRFISTDGLMCFIGYITGPLTDQGNWDDYPWTPITAWGTPATGQTMYLSWSRVGDKGDQGIQGIQGPVGPQGIMADAPSDGTTYGRRNVGWIAVTPATANNVPFVPAGNVAATNIQAAIQELDTEKVAKAGDTMSGALTITTNSPTINLNRNADGGVPNLQGSKNGLPRWRMDMGAGGESSGNAGSDFALYDFDDAGNYLGNPLHITRSNNRIDLAGVLYAAAGFLSPSGQNYKINQDGGGNLQRSSNGGAYQTLWDNGSVTGPTGNPGYIRLPSGLFIQWGQTGSVPAQQYVNVFYPIAFPNGTWGVWCDGVGGIMSTQCRSYTVDSATASYFVLTARYMMSGGGFGYDSAPCWWLAVGY